MAESDRCLMFVLSLFAGSALSGCYQKPATAPAAVTAHPVVAATPDSVLTQLTALGGSYQLDGNGRVWALSFHQCPLNDGDLEILRSLPDIQTMTLRGVTNAGGKLTVAGLKPLESVRELRRLDLSSNSFHGGLDALTELQHLEFLDLKGTEFGDDAMLQIAKIRSLKEIQLGHLEITEQGLQALCHSSAERVEYWLKGKEDVGTLGGLKKLRRWFIGFGNVPVERLSEFAGVDQLEEITIECDGAECPLASVDALRSMKSLQKLQISGMENSDWPILAALESLPDLKALRLIGVGDQALRRLPILKRLETFDLALSGPISEKGLTALQAMPELRHLALSPKTTSAAILELVSRNVQLETLVFTHNVIGKFLQQVYPIQQESVPGFAAADLRPVLQQTSLTMLQVGGLGFGDELLTEIAAATKLRHLNIADQPITDDGFKQLRRLKHLRWLGIDGTAVTYEAAYDLHKNYNPKCGITDNWCCGCMAFTPLESSAE